MNHKLCFILRFIYTEKAFLRSQIQFVFDEASGAINIPLVYLRP